MTEYSMNSPSFSIDFQLKMFEEDIKYPFNSILTVSVSSNGFSAVADMDIDIKKFKIFTDGISELYRTLNGTASIVESYGEQFISVSGDGSGYIYVSGHLSSGSESGSVQKLFFENSFDQTYLTDFLKSLSELCEEY